MKFKRTFIVKVHIYPIVVIDELSIKLERTHLPVLYIIQIEQLLFQKIRKHRVPWKFTLSIYFNPDFSDSSLCNSGGSLFVFKHVVLCCVNFFVVGFFVLQKFRNISLYSKLKLTELRRDVLIYLILNKWANDN